MEQFKLRWEITKNWQLIFPFLGILALLYSSFKLTNSIIKNQHIGFKIILTGLIFALLLKITLQIFKKLENKWVVNSRWEIIRIFIVFALTGSSSVLIGKPFIAFIGITKENLNIIIYWVLYIIFGIIFYQILLVLLGWISGQGKFFWEFEKKMLRRFGLGRFLD